MGIYELQEKAHGFHQSERKWLFVDWSDLSYGDRDREDRRLCRGFVQNPGQGKLWMRIRRPDSQEKAEGTMGDQNPRLDIDNSSDLGVYLHTALRKVCDNDITSLAYNLIALEDINVAWSTYLESAWAILQSVSTEGEMVKALRLAGEGLEFGRHDTNALRCCFRLFTDDDFRDMAAWVLK